MVPYSNYYFFYILFLILIPAIITGICGKRIKWYGIIASCFMLYLIFCNSWEELMYLIGFCALEFIIVNLYCIIRKRFNQRWILWIILLIALAPLLYTKFGHVFHMKIYGFLGISYVTFKVIGILIDIYDNLVVKIEIIDFIYFIVFFPTISSGPIDRWRRFKEEINKAPSRREYLEYLGEGLWKIVIGIGYKFIIGYFIYNNLVEKISAEKQHNIINIIKYMYSYSFYLFFDFAGYSLIAIGVSYILGVRTPDNFNLPFISKDMKDFWNRWHMSLSFWFRDYVYTRFVMSSLKKKWFKSKYTASYIGYIITMVTMGVWHGTELHYIIYGFYQAVLIILTDYFQRKKVYRNIKNKMWWKTISTVVTFNLICFGFLIFSGYILK